MGFQLVRYSKEIVEHRVELSLTEASNLFIADPYGFMAYVLEGEDLLRRDSTRSAEFASSNAWFSIWQHRFLIQIAVLGALASQYGVPLPLTTDTIVPIKYPVCACDCLPSPDSNQPNRQVLERISDRVAMYVGLKTSFIPKRDDPRILSPLPSFLSLEISESLCNRLAPSTPSLSFLPSAGIPSFPNRPSSSLFPALFISSTSPDSPAYGILLLSLPPPSIIDHVDTYSPKRDYRRNRSETEQDVEENISNGKSVSLVCRHFAPIGQALRWWLVVVDSSSISSLARHFAKFPHLAKLVRLLFRRTPLEETEETVEEEDTAFRGESLDDLLQVLNATTSLSCLELDAVNDLSSTSFLSRIIRTTGALPLLSEFVLNIYGPIVWTHEVARAFKGGFPVVNRLTLDLDIQSTPEDGLGAVALSTPRKKIETYEAMIEGNVCAALALGTHLFQQLDPSALSRCVLGGHLVREINYEFLSTCPSLTSLQLEFTTLDDAKSFSSLIKHLQRFQSLETLNFHSLVLPLESSTIVDANVTLARVLAAFPTTLRTFTAHLSFNDYESIPQRQPPESPHSKPVRLVALRPVDRGYDPLIVWKDEGEEGGGRKWYRSEICGSTEL
ncbi:uncharacterized protein JCM6883_003807 [Sporobolomyces salmoneus]|uniref:uncharacterized protein n=1 Tax=Sporobolomyces salmoneus TaxID=183962 RepID=UPI0031709D77